jgi:hypothetical protein
VFGITIVSGELADLRQVPSGVLVESGLRTRRVRIPPASGRSTMLDLAYRAIRDDIEVDIDAAWGVETVRIAELMERSDVAGRQPRGDWLDGLGS